jgi:thiamine pyrophosphate-dependent acetolactate synthase large subunit-like protein
VRYGGQILYCRREKYHKVLQTKQTYFRSPPTALIAAARYEKMIEAFGGRGYLAKTTDEINKYLTEVTKDPERVALLNILISPMSMRKQQVCQVVINV